MHADLCSYSIYSLQFYLLFPLVKLGQTFKFPVLVSYVMALGAPTLLFHYSVKLATNKNLITLVKHSPRSNHPHSSAITLSVILRSVILGLVFILGFSFIDNQLQPHFIPLGIYLVLLSFFHFSEYFVTSLTNPSTLSLSSFLLDQSSAYVFAISGSLLEYAIEVYSMPKFKKFNYISMFGLLMAIVGEVIRKSAMFTAGKNFSHTIVSTKSPDHKLITHGIYSILRHPSYAGWFYWAVGSQILLQNPICIILFTVISYNFFKDRICYEEETLIEFFKEDYMCYKERVGLWMPIKLKI